MRPPCEIITQELLPLIRGFVAYDLSQKMTQQEVAKLMGVSQPTISSYLKSHAKIKEMGNKEYLDNDSIKNLVKDISIKIQANSSAEEIINSICSTCVLLRIGGLTCRKHLSSYSGITQGCKGCLPINEKSLVDERQLLLTQIDEAIAIIENEKAFTKLMPQVRINLCQCIKNPKTIDDVAAIPGRITNVRGRVRALLPPEFGVSTHTAKLLINLQSINNSLLSIICIKYSPLIQKLLTTDIIQLHFDNEILTSLSNEILNSKLFMEKMDKNSLRKIQSFQKDDFLAIIHQGAIGIEPIIYLVGNDPISLACKCSEIARKI